MPGIDINRPRRKMSASESNEIQDQPVKSNKALYLAIVGIILIMAILCAGLVYA